MKELLFIIILSRKSNAEMREVMKERKKIILVDDQEINLDIGKNALSEEYDVLTASSGDNLLLLLKSIKPDVILLDILMPEMNGYEIIKIIKSNPETAHIPVIFLTSKSDEDSELEGLTLGAIDYIFKPFSPPLLLKRIETHLLIDEQKKLLKEQKELLEEQKKELINYSDNLEIMVRKKTRAVLELQDAILETVAELVECRDDITGRHIERTQKYLKILLDEIISRKLYTDEIESWDMELLVMSALLHDVGKIAISDSILLKPGNLTYEEFELIKKHTTFGEKVIDRIQRKTTEHAYLNYAKTLAASHHERWDGLGYPNGLKGTDIPLQGRLMAIADVYDALVSERPYKRPISHKEAVNIIIEGSGTQFDPALVNLFINAADKFDEVNKKVINTVN